MVFDIIMLGLGFLGFCFFIFIFYISNKCTCGGRYQETSFDITGDYITTIETCDKCGDKISTKQTVLEYYHHG